MSSPNVKSLNAQIAEMQLLLDKQTDELKRLAAERDDFRTKLNVLSLRLGAALKEKEDLQVELNSSRTKR